jgi:hypothetical protein
MEFFESVNNHDHTLLGEMSQGAHLRAWRFATTGFITGFVATRQSPGATSNKTSLRRSSEKLVVKARGEKGSEAC